MKRLLDTQLPDDVRRVLQSSEEDAHPIAITRLERSLAGTLGASSISGVSLRAEAANASPSVAPGASGAPAASSGGALASTALGAKVVIGLAALAALGAFALRSAGPHAATHVDAHAVPALAPTAVAPTSVAPAAVAPTAVPAALPVQAPALRSGASSRAHPARAAASSEAPALRGGAGQLSDEVRQLDVIRRYLRTDTARALAAADSHERRFPNGALGEERELLRIEALFRLGRNGEAQMRAEQLIASPAGKAYRRQVQRLIARYSRVPGG